MFVIQIICIILNILLAIVLKCCIDYYTDEHVKLPLKLWILWGIITLIPILSGTAVIGIGIFMIVSAEGGDIYWGLKLSENHWLNKEY